MSSITTLDGRQVDLTELSPADLATVEMLYGIRLTPETTPLRCTVDSKNWPMYLRRINNAYWATHFPGGGCGHDHAISGESDEHKYLKESWCRAAREAGFEAFVEKSLGRTRPDVLIGGPQPTGVEIQKSSIVGREVKRRSTLTHNAGVTPLWIASSGDDPSWMFRVPSARCNNDWTRMPLKGTTTVTNLRDLELVRCNVDNFTNCPQTHRNWCGRWHWKHSPILGMVLEDAAARIPAGDMVPVIFETGDTIIVPADSARQYADALGRDVAWNPTGKPTPKKDDRSEHPSRDCVSEVHTRIREIDDEPGSVSCDGMKKRFCVICQQQLLLMRPGRKICARRDPVHDAARRTTGESVLWSFIDREGRKQ